jgi:hypothetical protein
VAEPHLRGADGGAAGGSGDGRARGGADATATLAPVLPEGQQGDEKGEEEDEQGEEGDERLSVHLAELPEGLRAMAGEVRELAVRSTRLAVVPVWVGELTRLETLEISGVSDDEGNTLLK